MARACPVMLFYGAPRLTPTHHLVRTPEELRRMVSEVRAHARRGFDTETNGSRFASGKRPIGYTLGVQDPAGTARCWYVPFGHRTGEPQADEDAARAALVDAFAGVQEVVGHHLKFDENMARAWGVEIPKDAVFHDTLSQAYLIREDRPSFKLEDVVNSERASPWGDAYEVAKPHHSYLVQLAKSRGLPLKDDDKQNGVWSYLSAYGHSEVPVEFEAEYSCRDVAHALVLDARQRSRALGVGERFEDRRRFLYWNEMMLGRALADMEWHGQPVDAPYLRRLAVQLEVELDRRGKVLNGLFGRRIRWNNDGALRDFLYGDLGLPVVMKTDSGAASIERAAILILCAETKDARLLEIVEYRARLKVLQTYTRSLAFEVDADGCVHTSFLAHGTDTGRLSSKGPNLQNIPVRHKELAAAVRMAFLCRPGWGRIFADYSQVELRFLAWITGSAILTTGYRSPAYDRYCRGATSYDQYLVERSTEPEVDQHANVARSSAIGAKETDPDWKVKRRAAKIVNFGVAYGMGPTGLMTDPEVLMGKDEARALHTAYHQANPEIRAAQARLFASMREHSPPRFVNWAGQTRHVPALVYKDQDARAAAEREAFAALVQGSAAQLTKISIVRRYLLQRDNRSKGVTTSTVHDELQVDAPVEHLQEVAHETRREMENFRGMFGPTPIIADLEVSETNWAEKRKMHG